MSLNAFKTAKPYFFNSKQCIDFPLEFSSSDFVNGYRLFVFNSGRIHRGDGAFDTVGRLNNP